MTDDHYKPLYLRYTHHLNIHLRTALLTRRTNLTRTRTHERVDHQTWSVSHSSCSLFPLPTFELTDVICSVLLLCCILLMSAVHRQHQKHPAAQQPGEV